MIRRLALLSMLVYSCTTNPFWDDEHQPKMTISGTVIAENNQSEIPVTVWMETFDKLTTTDSLGNFQFIITESQGVNGSVNGEIQIYFFIYNYQLDSASIFFTNGQYSEDQTDFNSKGELLSSIELMKLFSGQLTILSPSDVENPQDSLYLNYTIDAHQNVDLSLYQLVYNDGRVNFGSKLFWRSLTTGDVYTHVLTGIDQYGNVKEAVKTFIQIEENESMVIPYLMLLNDLSLPTDSYEILPYVTISDMIIPDGLLKNMGGDSIFNYSSNFLEIPFDHLPDTLNFTHE